MNLLNYKTQSGLTKALEKARLEPMSVKKAWWYKSAEWALINKWGWEEEKAANIYC